jgi:NAD+ diphosphatase
MEKEIQMTFVSSYKPPEKMPEDALWFLFHDQRLLVKEEESNLLIPESSDLRSLALSPIQAQYLGRLNDRPSYAGELEGEKGGSAPFSFMGLRSLFMRCDEDTIQAAGMASQLVHWNRNHRYCGRCGGLTDAKTDERARVCPRCGLINYPRLSPAIIVAVLKDHRILLAHSQRFPAKFYSVLAGFVEPGETLEACVKREILEEVGIKIKNIRYFGSQPWPFPDSLMIGFTAEYADGDIRIDPSEITDAGWFAASELPPIPPKISIARRLIDWFLEREDKGSCVQ